MRDVLTLPPVGTRRLPTLTVGTAARITGYHPATIRRALLRGDLEGYRAGTRTRHALSRWASPCCSPTTTVDQRRSSSTTFNFSQSRRNVDAGYIPVLLDHDPKLEVGKLRSLTPNREWWICAFELREDVIREPFEVGQPVSVGLGWTDGYVSSPWVSEVSIVRRGRVPGAEITHRMPMPVPAPAPASVPRTATKRPEPAGEVIYGGGRSSATTSAT